MLCHRFGRLIDCDCLDLGSLLSPNAFRELLVYLVEDAISEPSSETPYRCGTSIIDALVVFRGRTFEVLIAPVRDEGYLDVDIAIGVGGGRLNFGGYTQTHCLSQFRHDIQKIMSNEKRTARLDIDGFCLEFSSMDSYSTYLMAMYLEVSDKRTGVVSSAVSMHGADQLGPPPSIAINVRDHIEADALGIALHRMSQAILVSNNH